MSKPGGPISGAFGPEIVTVYSNSPLNRLSFLRDDYAFLDAALAYSKTRVLPFLDLNPLLREADARDDKQRQELAFFPVERMRQLIGTPYKEPLETQVKNWSADAGVEHVQLVFLGVDESDRGFQYKEYGGLPYFAASLTLDPLATPRLRSAVEAFVGEAEMVGEFQSAKYSRLPRSQYPIVAEAQMLIDWNQRTRFCAGCGKRNMSVHGGFKLECPPSNGEHCPTRGKITNVQFPRTDCSIIVAVLNHSADKILLGRNRRWPENMYSCLAGFLEPGESIEDCVRREVYEETGVTVGRVLLHSSQPWPYPANIMLGCLAEVKDSSKESSTIRLDHDKELEDAQWFPVSVVRAALDDRSGALTVPPPSAIAWTLLDAATSDAIKQHL